MISGGHLVAKALKNEGVDTIFTLCGGHIIDIYDGCIDEGIRIIDVRHEQVAAHAADGYARQTGKLGCVVTTAGPGCTNAVTGIATAFRSESPVLHIGGQGALDAAQDGLAAGSAARRHDDADHEIRRRPCPSTERIADMVVDGGARVLRRRARARPISKSRATCSTARSPSKGGACRKPGHYRASTKSVGDPRDIEKLADILVKAERPAILFGQQVWTARGHDEAIALLRGLDIPGYFNGAGRGMLPPGDPHHFDRTRSLAFAKADVIVIVGTPFDFRMGYGRRIATPTLVQIDHGLPHGRQEPRHRRSASSAIPARCSARCCRPPSGRIKNDKRQARRSG